MYEVSVKLADFTLLGKVEPLLVLVKRLSWLASSIPTFLAACVVWHRSDEHHTLLHVLLEVRVEPARHQSQKPSRDPLSVYGQLILN